MGRAVIKPWGIFLLFVVAFSCADTDFTSNTPSTDDEDEDGYGRELDCDDKDPNIYPGAPERENCLDDNCDGKIDEGTANYDQDGDGFCVSTGDVGDCEGNRARNPAVAEDGGDGSDEPNGIDDNCNSLIDEGLPSSDLDQDGFAARDGDCNDSDPYINPGAIEVAGMACSDATECPIGQCHGGFCRCAADADCGSGDACEDDTSCKYPGEKCTDYVCVTTYTCMPPTEGMTNPELNVCRDNTDNDCNKEIDEIHGGCDELALLKVNDAYDYAKAIELCDTDLECGVEGKCPGQMKCVKGKCSRLLSASFNSDVDPRAHTIAKQFAQKGPIKPQMGESFIVLSTGFADYDPAVDCPQPGNELNTPSHKDPDPNAENPEANDYIELALEILVPSNAQSFAFDFQFFSTEYPEWVGSPYNDTFWVNLESVKFKGNISFDKNDTPIRINNAFFDICDPYPEKPETTNMCSQPAVLLTGTGYAKECGYTDMPNGGSTGWLHTTSPVTPGEVIKLTFSIFDKGDSVLDSAVVIDNFRWKLNPASKPSTGPD